MKSVVDFLEKNAIKYPDKIAVSCKKNKITYFELNKRANQFANMLLKKGIERGDIVYLYLNKSINKVMAIFGIMKCGAGVAIINWSYKAEHINQIIREYQSPLLITNEMIFSTIEEKIKRIDTYFLSNNDNSDCFDEDDEDLDIEINPEDIGVVIFTSGSSGKPKGVKISNINLIQRTIGEVESFKLTAEDNILNVLTFSFDVGLNQFLTSFYVGAKLVLHDFIFVRSLLRCIKKESITGFSAVPTIWTRLLNESDLLIEDDLKSLRYVTISGGSLSKKHLKELLNLLKGIEIIKTYGQTETFRSTMLFCRSVEDTEKIYSIGKAIDGVELIVADTERKKICQSGETGELIHIGHGIMTGYVDETHSDKKLVEISSLGFDIKTKSKHSILTGDIVSIDEDGYVYYQGRKDDMLKISGYRIYPREIEDILIQNQNVKEAVVWGVDDDLLGESLYAVITLKNNTKIEADDILDHCKKMIPQYIIPQKVSIIDRMPLMANGKIDILSLKTRFTANHV